MRRALPALVVVAAVASCLSYASGASASATKRVVALSAAAVVLAVWLAYGERKRDSANLAWVLALAFVAWSALSAAWGSEDALLGLCVPVAALGLGAVSASFTVETSRRVATLAAFGVAVPLALVIVVAFGFGGRGFALHAGQGNPNWAALLLAVALPLAVSEPLLATWSERLRRSLRVGSGLVGGAAIVATESRTALVAAFAGVGVLALGAARRGLRRAGAAALVTLASLAAVALTHAVTAGVPAAGIERALDGRLWIHGITARATLDRLPWGAGLASFHEAFLAEQGRALAELEPNEASRRFENATTAHQEFLEVTLESGPIALLLFAGALWLAFRRHARSGFHAGAGALAAFATASLADSPWRETPAPILLALVFAALPRAVAERAAPLPGRDVVLRLALLASAGSLLPGALGAFLASRSRSAALHAPLERRLALLRHAASLHPTNAAVALELGAARLELGDAAGAVRELHRAERLDADPASAVALGNALVAHGDFEAAREAYERAVALNPGSFRARVGLAEALRRLGRYAGAETHAALAVTLLPGDARARELLDQVREQRADSALGVTPHE